MACKVTLMAVFLLVLLTAAATGRELQRTDRTDSHNCCFPVRLPCCETGTSTPSAPTSQDRTDGLDSHNCCFPVRLPCCPPALPASTSAASTGRTDRNEKLNFRRVADELEYFRRSNESYRLEGRGDLDAKEVDSQPDYWFYNFMKEEYRLLSPSPDPGHLNVMSPSDDEAKRDNHHTVLSLASLELLKSNPAGFRKLNGKRIIDLMCPVRVITDERPRLLSVIDILKIAGMKSIHTAPKTNGDNPYDIWGQNVSCFTGLTDEEAKNVQLVEKLFDVVEKVGKQQFDEASSLLDEIDKCCSNTGRTVERIVFYFSEALREKIDRGTCQVSMKKRLTSNPHEVIKQPTPQMFACYRRIPFHQILQFAGVQVIIDHAMDARRIHIIDLSIRNGSHWTVLLQALAMRRHEPRVQHITITVITTCPRKLVSGTGKVLESFANSLGFLFSYKVIVLSDMLDLREDMLAVDVEEDDCYVVVYADFLLKGMIPKPNRLEWLMKVLSNINPSVVVINEVQSNHNSPNFTNRFVESLFYYSAYFDSLDECREEGDAISEVQKMTESVLFGQAIRTILAAEGEDRNIRHVKIDVWRAFFTRFGLEELDLGMASMYQAELVARKFARRSSCTLDLDGKSLIIGWKGIPIFSLSAWKFQ